MSFSSNFRSAIVFALVFVLLNTDSVVAQSLRQSDSRFEFPYQAMARHADTEIFSGPADVHYATDSIGQGEIVEVYRHDPGGWCAIRPNKGSFSLIPAAAVEVIGDDLGKVTLDNTQAWVGTRLGSVEKPLWQIKLKAGEEVEIFGEASWPSPDGNSTVWYQIAPPAGEFRWVRLSDLNTPPTATSPTAIPPIADAARRPALAVSAPKASVPKASVPSTEQEDESGFKYVGLDDSSNRAPASDKQLVSAPENQSPSAGFKYVKPASGEPPRDDRTQVANAKQPKSAWGQATSEWATSDEPSKRNPSGNTANRNPNPAFASRPRRSASGPANQLAAAPSKDEGVDFKFRPIGQTAVSKGHFQSSPNQDRDLANRGLANRGSANRGSLNKGSERRNSVIRDSAVVPAAFQQPIDDYRASDRGFVDSSSSSDTQWQRGREEIARRKSQYEARYDEFNSRVRDPAQDRFGFREADRRGGDHRDVEESFGVSLEELPDHPRTSRDRTYQTLPPGRSYTTTYENPYPQDRFASLGPVATAPITHSALAAKLTGRLSKVEEQLTNEMLKRPNEWQLADLELGVGQVYSQTTNPVERLQAQRILDKIGKCKVIRNGYTKNFQATGEVFGTSVIALDNARKGGPGASRSTLGSGSGSGTRTGSGTSYAANQSSNLVGSGVNTDFEVDTRFDAAGWLTELVSEDRNNRPVYVLLNDSGKITHHVAAAPGLNLNRYLKSKVGVVGRRGYNNRMKLDHITADSVDEIQRY